VVIVVVVVVLIVLYHVVVVYLDAAVVVVVATFAIDRVFVGYNIPDWNKRFVGVDNGDPKRPEYPIYPIPDTS